MEETNLTPILAEASPPMMVEQVPSEILADEEPSTLDKIKAADEAREGFPGEHWLVLVLGIAVWQFTRKHRNWVVRTAGGFAASALVARAASGRQGLSKVLRYTPFGRGISSCPPCDAKAVEQQQATPQRKASPQRESHPFPTTASMSRH